VRASRPALNGKVPNGDQAAMKVSWNISPLADQLRSDTRGIVLMALLIGGLILWALIAGKTDRVVYRGVDKVGWAGPEMAHLNTDPPGNYIMERNARFESLKPGCVYDLNYDVEFGRNRSTNRVKTVRSATLVRC